MSYRPYFRSSIEELEKLVASKANDLRTLKVVQYELRHRDRPRAKALKEEVDARIVLLASGSPTEPPQAPPNREALITETTPPSVVDDFRVERVLGGAAARLAVDCPGCGTKNFVFPAEGVTQHLACSGCKTSFEARFAYGTLRTVFQSKAVRRAHGWIMPSMMTLAVIMLLLFAASVVFQGAR